MLPRGFKLLIVFILISAFSAGVFPVVENVMKIKSIK